MKLNLAAGTNPLPGFENYADPWRFQHGLDEKDGSVEAATISHALMFLPDECWDDAFAEFYRVLEPGGILRVTEDYCTHPQSERYGGHPDAVTMTSPRAVKYAMKCAGFREVHDLSADETFFKDKSLCQTFHGPYPKTFHCEGIK